MHTLNLDPTLVKAFQECLGTSKMVLIGTHLNPDGDALGSALALSHFLWSHGIRNEVLCHNVPPANLQFLPGCDQIRQTPVHDGHDLGIIVDLESVDRLGSTACYFEALPRLVVIDHHVPHEKPGDIRIIDVEASATTVILSNLMEDLGGPIDAKVATCLLTGIVTDTGSFRFRNTNPDALHWAAKLLEAGADLNQISEEVFARKPRAAVLLLGKTLDRMVLDSDDRLAYASISHQLFTAVGAEDEHTEGFVNELLSIQTVQIAALLREPKPGRIRVSLRSRGDLDVATIAQELGGGGHRNAAGISFDMALHDAEALLVPRLKACLESS